MATPSKPMELLSHMAKEACRVAQFLDGLAEAKDAFITAVLTGEERRLRVHLETWEVNGNWRKYFKALLLPRSKYVTEDTSSEDFLLAIAQDVIVRELTRRYRNENDETSFARLWAAYKDPLVGFAFRRGIRDLHKCEEIAHDTLMMGPIEFDPLLGSWEALLYTHAKLLIRRSYTKPTPSETPTKLYSWPSRDDITFLPAELELFVSEARLSLIFTHRIERALTYIVHHECGWTPERILKCFRQASLDNFLKCCQVEYSRCSELPLEYVRSLIDARGLDLRTSSHERIGDTLVDTYFAPGRSAAQRINDWTNEMTISMSRKIDRAKIGFLSLVFNGPETEAEILVFALVRFTGVPAEQGQPYMTERLHDVLNKRLKPACLSRFQLQERDWTTVIGSFASRVPLDNRYPDSTVDPIVWVNTVRNRVRGELVAHLRRGEPATLLYAFSQNLI